MSWTFSERLMYVQFTSCVYGEVNYRNTRKRCEIFSLLFYCFWKVIYPDDQNIQVEFEYSSPPVLTWDVFMSLGVAVSNDLPQISTSQLSSVNSDFQKKPSEVFYEKSVLRTFAKFIGKHLKNIFFTEPLRTAASGLLSHYLVVNTDSGEVFSE